MDIKSAPSVIDLPSSLAEIVDPATTALVMWDMQKCLAGQAPNLAQLVENGGKLARAARSAGIPVFWSRHNYLPLALLNGPWQRYLMRKNKFERREQLEPVLAAARSRADFLDDLAPTPEDIIIDKFQPSLFLDTAFETFLVARGIRSVVLTGFTTDIGIDFTARHAHARGFYAVVVEDATGAFDPAEHDRSIGFLRKWVDVATADEIAGIWAKQGAQ